MPTSQEMRVQRTFDKAMDQINNLQKVFRDEGMLAKAVVDIGGDQDFGAIQEAFDNLYGALEDGNYDALAHLAVESAKQKLGMTEENKTIKPQGKQAEIDLAGDSIWDRQGENPAKVYVMSITIENPYEPGGYMDDDEDDGYRKVDVEHNGPWTIYTDSGFAEGISGLVGFPVDFTEQGMQEDGMASLESTMDDAMESVQEGKLTEGYESKVLKICKDEEIDCSFKDGKLHLDKSDMAKAKKALKDDEDIKELPDMVAESVAETNTDDDARKEQSLELTRLKQLIGTDTIREMKQ
tara:strand:- start:293 stop:1177 length:885 start_codon:yes stop_codon:yes gene_type:complete